MTKLLSESELERIQSNLPAMNFDDPMTEMSNPEAYTVATLLAHIDALKDARFAAFDVDMLRYWAEMTPTLREEIEAEVARKVEAGDVGWSHLYGEYENNEPRRFGLLEDQELRLLHQAIVQSQIDASVIPGAVVELRAEIAAEMDARAKESEGA